MVRPNALVLITLGALALAVYNVYAERPTKEQVEKLENFDVIPGVDMTERDILMDFYENFGGPNWIKEEGWGTEAPVCGWHGVRCSDSGKVLGMALNNNNLRGDLFKAGKLAYLPSFSFIMLNENFLTGGIPDLWCHAKHLEHVHMIYNFLTYIPECFPGSKDPRTIGVASNELKKIPKKLLDLFVEAGDGRVNYADNPAAADSDEFDIAKGAFMGYTRKRGPGEDGLTLIGPDGEVPAPQKGDGVAGQTNRREL